MRIVDDNAGWYKEGHNQAIEKEVGYQIVPCSRQLPYLNVIENVWQMWKGRLRKQFSRRKIPVGAFDLGGSLGIGGTLVRTYTEDELWTACMEKCDAIEPDKIDDLIRTMLQRIQSIIQAEGGHTKS